MWVYLKKQGTFFKFSDDMIIDEGEGGGYHVTGNKFTNVDNWSKDTVDIFVSQFEHALRHKEFVFTFDEDKPKFTMRLSGRDDEGEQQSEVGIE